MWEAMECLAAGVTAVWKMWWVFGQMAPWGWFCEPRLEHACMLERASVNAIWPWSAEPPASPGLHGTQLKAEVGRKEDVAGGGFGGRPTPPGRPQKVVSDQAGEMAAPSPLLALFHPPEATQGLSSWQGVPTPVAGCRAACHPWTLLNIGFVQRLVEVGGRLLRPAGHGATPTLSGGLRPPTLMALCTPQLPRAPHRLAPQALSIYRERGIGNSEKGQAPDGRARAHHEGGDYAEAPDLHRLGVGRVQPQPAH